jgi:U3 small nucleolar RNA-associated protein 7
VEAVDIASAAKVSLRMAKGPAGRLMVQNKTGVGTRKFLKGTNSLFSFFHYSLLQHFDLNLRQFGPYRLNYSRTGR